MIEQQNTGKIRAFKTCNRWKVPLAIATLSFILRVWDTTRPINTDEAKWLSRGAAFAEAVLAGDLAETYQSPHPGILTMWVSGLGMMINSLLSHWRPQWLGLEHAVDLAAFAHRVDFPVNLYVCPRLLQALLTSGCMVGLYLLSRRLFGNAIAVLAMLLLTLEPFFLSYQRFITTDALHANLGSLSLLLLLLYLSPNVPSTGPWETERTTPHPVFPYPRPRQILLMGSGVTMGLSAGAKVISLFAVPIIVLWLIGAEWFTAPGFKALGWKRRIQDLGMWGATGVITVFLSWPVTWIQPGYTLNRMIEGLIDESQRGNFFFMGEFTHSPSLLFYPVVLIFRLSPLLLIGLMSSAIALLIALRRHYLHRHYLHRHYSKTSPHVPLLAPSHLHAYLALWLLVLGFVILLSVSSTKIDRYITFVIPSMALLAAYGWMAIARWIVAGLGRWQRWCDRLHLPTLKPINQAHNDRDGPTLSRLNSSVMIVLGSTLVIGQLMILVPNAPYYLTYFNPLLGGSKVAEQLLMVGQGEGLDQVAWWLQQDPDADQLVVATAYPAVMSAYFDGQIRTLPTEEKIADPIFWNQSQKVVFYINQKQRQLPSAAFNRYFTTQPHHLEIKKNGIAYAWVYPGPVPTQTTLQSIPHPNDVVFGDRIHLLGYALTTAVGQEHRHPLLTLYWDMLKTLPQDARLVMELRASPSRQASQRQVIQGQVIQGQVIQGQASQRQNKVVYRTKEPLLAGLVPTGTLQAGHAIQDAHVLSIPSDVAPGHYQLYLGWQSKQANALTVNSSQAGRRKKMVQIGELDYS